MGAYSLFSLCSPIAYANPGFWKKDNGIPEYGLTDFGQDDVLTNLAGIGFEFNGIEAFVAGQSQPKASMDKLIA